MHPILESIFNTKTFLTSNNKLVKVDSETSREQCMFLQDIIQKNKFVKSLEIGFAFGLSTAAILEAILKNGGSHVAIDKFENSDWNGNGIDLVRQAGYIDQLEFFEEYCYVVLPALLAQGR